MNCTILALAKTIVPQHFSGYSFMCCIKDVEGLLTNRKKSKVIWKLLKTDFSNDR